MSSHALLSPSSAARWSRCPGSVHLIQSLGASADGANRYSAEGTFAHSMRAMMLAGEEVIGLSANVDGYQFVCDAEMVSNLRPGVVSLLTHGEPLVETRVSLQRWVPGCFGTADALVVSGKTLIVNDLKYGTKPVPAERNEQLMIYALGALDLLAEGYHDRFRTIRLEIDQPRAPGGGSVWQCTTAELLEFGEWIRIRGYEAMRPGAALRPSDEACQWCPARAVCPALAATMVDALQVRESWTPPQALTASERSRVLSMRGLIDTWLDSLYKEALDEALAGIEQPGMKLVQGKAGNRQWADRKAAQDALVECLGDDAYAVSLISPAQAEKILGKNYPIPDTVRTEGKLSLVPDTDKRPAAISAAHFDDVVTIEVQSAWETTAHEQ